MFKIPRLQQEAELAGDIELVLRVHLELRHLDIYLAYERATTQHAAVQVNDQLVSDPNGSKVT